MLRLGRSSHTNLKDVLVRLVDLCMHLVVLGESGFGKTTLITNLLTQVWNLRPSMPWLVFDLKGEYLRQLSHIDGLHVLRPSFGDIKSSGRRMEWADEYGEVHQATLMPLRMNLLDEADRVDGEDGRRRVISRITTLLKASLSSSLNEGSELSPLMERILWEVLHRAYTNPRGEKGFFDMLIDGVEAYIDQYGKGRSDIVRSGEALINRVERFRRGYLSEVLNRGEPTLTSDLLSRGKIIIDLSECVAHGGLDDLRLLLNLVVEKVFEEATKRGLTQKHEVRHLTVVEEASLLVPEILRRKSTGDITSTEEMFLIARGYGEGFILVAQRPTISSFTLSNAGTKVIFRTPCDTRRIGEILGINEIGQQTIKNLKKFEAFAVTIEGGPQKIITPKPRLLGHETPFQELLAGLSQREESPTNTHTASTTPDRSQESPLPGPRSPRPPARSPDASVFSPPTSIRAAESRGVPRRGEGGGGSGESVDCEPTRTNQQGDGGGGAVVDGEDLSRLLKKGLASDKFRLFNVIATSPQSRIAVSDAVDRIFQGRKWKYLDAVRSLTSRTLWIKPPLTLKDYGARIQLTEYGSALWKLVQPLLAGVKQKH